MNTNWYATTRQITGKIFYHYCYVVEGEPKDGSRATIEHACKRGFHRGRSKALACAQRAAERRNKGV